MLDERYIQEDDDYDDSNADSSYYETVDENEVKS
jgi:hypothetical protein